MFRPRSFASSTSRSSKPSRETTPLTARRTRSIRSFCSSFDFKISGPPEKRKGGKPMGSCLSAVTHGLAHLFLAITPREGFARDLESYCRLALGKRKVAHQSLPH